MNDRRSNTWSRAAALALLAVFSARELLQSAAQADPRRWLKPMLAGALLLAAALPIGGFLVSASGLIPIKASSGHWAITRWFLDFSSHRSVSTHAFGIAVPPLDDRLLVTKGAGAYEVSCRFCHGSPEVPQSTLARSMTPTPPYLPTVLALWSTDELFYLVKHGIKFTGMPAWPSRTRDDEVWAMVAFLLRLPALDAESYRALAGDVPFLREPSAGNARFSAEVTQLVDTRCASCHGTDGLGRDVGSFPRLARQHAPYLEASLLAFAGRARHSGVMGPIASDLTTRQAQRLAAYYAAQPVPAHARAAPAADAAAITRGRMIAERGIPARNVPKCADCHGPGSRDHNPMYPQLAGQFAEYLQLQLTLFKQERRGGTAYAHLMQAVAPGLEEAQMRDVALYYASLEPHAH